jgi:hypothetical protein
MLVFAYSLIVKGCLFDGWRGWYYVLQRTLAEIMLTLEIVDRRLGRSSHKSSPTSDARTHARDSSALPSPASVALAREQRGKP